MSRGLCLPTLIVGLALLVPQPDAVLAEGPSIDPAKEYLLQNKFLEGKFNLVAKENTVESFPAAFYTGSPIVLANGLWKFEPAQDAPGYYRVTNAGATFRYEGKPFASPKRIKKLLTIEPSAPFRPRMVDSEKTIAEGELWRFLPADGYPGYFRLTNGLRDGELVLDTSGDQPHPPMMVDAAAPLTTGQLWKLSEASGARIDHELSYRLQNQFLAGKYTFAIGIHNDKPHVEMADVKNQTGDNSLWMLDPVAASPGYFTIRSRGAKVRFGAGTNYCLDVLGEAPYSPVIVPLSNPPLTGQLWKFVGIAGNAAFPLRLTNAFLEGKRHLDVYGASPYTPVMSDANLPTGQAWKFFDATDPLAIQTAPVELFAEAYTAPSFIWSAGWSGKQNADTHEYLIEGTYPLLNFPKDAKYKFKPIPDDSAVYAYGQSGGKLRYFDDVQNQVAIGLEADADDTSIVGAKRNKVTLRQKANVEFIGDRRTVTISDVTPLVNSYFTGPYDKGSNTAVGFYLESVQIKFTNLSKGWEQPVYGPQTTNNQVGYSITKTKGVNFEGSKVGPSGGANFSESSSGSANIADYKFQSKFDSDGISPVYYWTLGNVYDGDEKAIPYKSFTDVIHRTTVGQVDRVVDVPSLAKGTFIPTAYCGWTAPADRVTEDLRIQVNYEVVYREVHVKREANGGKEFGQGFLRGFTFLFNQQFYEDPKNYFSNPNTSYASTKVTQRFGQVVTVPKEAIVAPFEQ